MEPIWMPDEEYYIEFLPTEPEPMSNPTPLADRQAAALDAARVGGNLGEADAILATMTWDELCDLVAAMIRLKPRAMSLITGERKDARRRA